MHGFRFLGFCFMSAELFERPSDEEARGELDYFVFFARGSQREGICIGGGVAQADGLRLFAFNDG
jgi:hypothetical protein